MNEINSEVTAAQVSGRPKIHYHDVRGCSDFLDPTIIAGVVDYGARILAGSYPGDLVVATEACRPHEAFIMEHYRQVGLPVGELVWSDDCEVLRMYADTHEPNLFFYGDQTHEIIQDDNWNSVVKLMNSKNFAISNVFDQNSIPTPKTQCYDHKNVFHEYAWDYPVMFKPASGVSGVGIKVCENRQDLLDCVKQSDWPFQIQEYKEGISFLNLQYRVVEGKLERYIFSEQIIEGNAHMGNRFPIDALIESSVGFQMALDADCAAKWMFKNGMRGTFAFDVMVTHTNDVLSYFFLECNPRYNGASYPSVVAERLNATAWSHKFVKTASDNFQGLSLGNLTYDANRGSGVVIVNWGAINGKKLGVMYIAPTIAEQQALEEKFCQLVS